MLCIPLTHGLIWKICKLLIHRDERTCSVSASISMLQGQLSQQRSKVIQLVCGLKMYTKMHLYEITWCEKVSDATLQHHILLCFACSILFNSAHTL